MLYAGQALCGQPGLPREWPPGHVWVSLQESQMATCRHCRAHLTPEVHP